MKTIHSTYSRTLPVLTPASYPPLPKRHVPLGQIVIPRKTGLDPLHEVLLGILATHAFQNSGAWQPMLFAEFMVIAQKVLNSDEFSAIQETLVELQKNHIEIIHLRNPKELAYILPIPTFATLATQATIWEVMCY